MSTTKMYVTELQELCNNKLKEAAKYSEMPDADTCISVCRRLLLLCKYSGENFVTVAG